MLRRPGGIVTGAPSSFIRLSIFISSTAMPSCICRNARLRRIFFPADGTPLWVATCEYISEALHREAAEELGFYDYNPIYLGSYVFQSEVEREMVNIFAAVGNFTLHPDAEEVEEGRYWPLDEIEENIGNSIFTPNFEGEFRKIRRSLEALL